MAALAFSGCGGDDDDVGDPIPAATADSLKLKLDQFQDAMDTGEACADGAIDARIQNLQSEISRLGGQGVGSDVQNALDDGVTNLRSLALDKCNQVDDEETETVPTETVPTETTPVPTETVPPPVTETTPPPTTTVPEPPVDEGDGGEQFEPDDGGAGPDGEGPPGQIGKVKEDR